MKAPRVLARFASPSLRAVLGLLLCLVVTETFAATSSELAVELVKQQQQDGGTLREAMWIPAEFFISSVPNATPEQISRIRQAFAGYVLFLVIDARISGPENVIATPRELILADIRLGFNGAPNQAPVADSELKGDIAGLMEAFKPIMKNLLGKLGAAAQMIAFRSEEIPGATELKPEGSGQLRLFLGGVEFSWRLPLGAVLAPRFDPVSGEKFPGNYRFSPFTGHELVTHDSGS